MRQFAYVLLTGFILAFFSEWSFWSGRPAAEFFYLEAIPTWLAYSCLAYFFLMTVRYFRVQSIWAFFLAGAVYGWLGEGVLVQTMYDNFPLQISWTGLAWHALISVLFGIVYLPKQLREGRALLPCLLAGLVLGIWMIGWWLEREVQAMIAAVGDGLLINVWLYNFFFGLLLIPAYYFWLRFDNADFEVKVKGRWWRRLFRRLISGMLALVLFYLFYVGIQIQPLALIILPICLGIAFFGLWRNRQNNPPLPKSTHKSIRFKQLFPLLLIPVVSCVVYTVALFFGLGLPSLQLVYYITLPLGFLMFGLSLWKLFRVIQPQTN